MCKCRFRQGDPAAMEYVAMVEELLQASLAALQTAENIGKVGPSLLIDQVSGWDHPPHTHTHTPHVAPHWCLVCVC